MQELDLHSIRPDAKSNSRSVSSTKTESTGAAVHRGASQPNLGQRYYILQINDYWLYFCMILDLFSRRVIGYRVSRNASTHLVTSTFRDAYQARGNPIGLTFHSDRGAQYTSVTLTELLQKCGAKQSFSATARPHDNAVAEAFFASFKKRRRTAGSTPRSKATAKAWRNMSNSIMSCDPIGP